MVEVLEEGKNKEDTEEGRDEKYKLHGMGNRIKILPLIVVELLMESSKISGNFYMLLFPHLYNKQVLFDELCIFLCLF